MAVAASRRSSFRRAVRSKPANALTLLPAAQITRYVKRNKIRCLKGIGLILIDFSNTQRIAEGVTAEIIAEKAGVPMKNLKPSKRFKPVR
jgi:hypothetical protein